jgi:hypothetical protein
MSTVAALVVTNRPHFVFWFTHQIGKQSRKPDEVIIVTNSDNPDAFDYDDIKRRLSVDNLVLYKQPPDSHPRVPLGGLRQKCLDLSSSDILLWFDDDDWYHPLRIELSAPPIESGRYDASIFPITHTYYVEEKLLFLREGGIGVFLPASAWRSRLVKKAVFANVDLGEDGRWINRIVHPEDGVEPFISSVRVYCVPDYIKPDVGCIILVHSRNVWQYPFSERYLGMGVVPIPKWWTPKGVSKEEWDLTKQMLDEMSAVSVEHAPAVRRQDEWGKYDQGVELMPVPLPLRHPA